MTVHISNSEIATFKRCRRKWWLTYYRSLLPRSKKVTGPLALGSRVHNALEARYKDGDDLVRAYVRLLEEDRLIAAANGDDMDKFEKEGELGRIMVEGYDEWVAEEGLDADLEILGSEEILKMPMFDGEAILVGKLDLRVRRKFDGTNSALDFKTVMNTHDFLAMSHMDEQLMTYILLDSQQEDTERVDGAIFRLLRKVKRSSSAVPPFYEEITIRHNVFTMRSFWKRIHGTVNDILKTRTALDNGADHSYVAYPTPTRNCTFDCFGGETQYLTRDGVKTLEATAGTTQYVLDSTARWVPAEIKEFGKQELLAVNLRRGRAVKTVYATARHRWFTDMPRLAAGQRRRRSERELLTTDLSPGMTLSTTVPPNYTDRYSISPVGVMHGFTVGDGSIRNKGAVAYLHGDKDQQLAKYFGLQRIDHSERPEASVVKDLPRFFKTMRPALDENCSYLYSWLAGYFAADGSVSSAGQMTLHSADRGLLEHARDICHVLGIQVWSLSEATTGKGRYKDSPLFVMRLNARTVTEDFLLLTEHRSRWKTATSRPRHPRSMSWQVESVEPTDRHEIVYCAVVPSTHSFTLDGYILTGNCNFKAICPLFDDGSAAESAIEDAYEVGNAYARYGDELK